jgi:16S rRNA (cytosine967-C5)-methyltransferase
MKGDTRQRAARIILSWIEEGTFPDRLISGETKDRAFLMEVSYGAIKWKRQLDWYLERLVNREPDSILQAHLMAALYQVFHMDFLEPYALVDETVEAVKTVRGKAVAGFANAVIRKALREKAALQAALAREAPLAVRESHPDILVDRWTRLLGEEKTASILKWNNSRPGVTVRIQSSRVKPEELMERWTREGVVFQPHPAFPGRCLTLGRGLEVTRLPGWSEGWLAVQDPSTLVAVDLVEPTAGERILDACSAPGGKLADMADRMGGGEGLVALDVSKSRLAHVRENLTRLGVQGVTVMQGDLAQALTVRELLKGGAFDRVLLDAPCTNTGVLRRRPDARWRFSAESVAEMAGVQDRLMTAAAGLVKGGGRLVYSTCSMEPEEDGLLVKGWLSRNPGWRKAAERQWLPGEHEADGSYAVALVKA